LSELLQKPIAALLARAVDRPTGYVDDVLSHAARRNEQWYWIAPEDYSDLCDKYRQTPTESELATNPRLAVCWACGSRRTCAVWMLSPCNRNRALRGDARYDCPSGKWAHLPKPFVVPAGAIETCMACSANGSCAMICKTCGGTISLHGPCPVGKW
jgi:hypothetical protein